MRHYNNLFHLHGKTAIITGGGGILGQEFCHALASHGANIAIIDINSNINNLSKELNDEYSIKSLPFIGDITDQDAINRMVSDIYKHFGTIDILHNNAATKGDDVAKFFANSQDYDMQTWRNIMAVNLDAMFMMARSVIPKMVENGGGSIIQTSSIYGMLAPDQRIYDGAIYMDMPINTPAIYSASKAGVLGLTQYLASYHASNNIRVNSLTLGGVESGQNEQFKQQYAKRVPLNRMANIDEVVGALIFLSSDAASYITGQNIVVDGGLSCW